MGKPLDIAPGFFEGRARKSAKNALIRNLVFLTLPIGCIALWIDLRVTGEPIEPVVLVVELAFFALIAWRVLVAVGRLRDPLKHPTMLDFAKLGDARELAGEVETAAQSESAVVFEDAVVTDRFLVAVGIVHAVIELTDIAWLFPKSTRHSVNFIPMGTTHSIELYTFSSSRRWVSLTMTSDSKLLETLQRRAKNARLGFSQDNETWWKATRLKLSTDDRALRQAAAAAKR